MADITQRLGFDVSQGVGALNQLKGTVDALSQSLEKLNKIKLGSVGRSINTFTKNLDKVPASANNAAAALGKLGDSVGFRGANDGTKKLKDGIDQVGDTAERTGKRITSTLGASFVFAKATSALREIKELLLGAAESANEFQLQVAEVQTIAGGASLDQLAASIRKVSLEFGGPDVKVAEAAYQAFSNQVVQSTSELEAFLPTVERLRIATGSDAADAVNALSSVLNTYGESAGTAEEISDVLFKTVELGRTKFSEFANSLGTINSIAKEAGVSFTEVQAGIADITKTGTTTSVALTQLRGIFTKLVKPTDKLRTAFRELGAKDGPSFVKASGGLFQALQKLQEFADKSGISIVELFGRVRGGQGALNILRDEGESFNDTLNQLEDSAGSAKEAFDKVAATDAFQTNIAFNELNSRITELGDSLIPVIGGFVKMFNEAIPNTQSLALLIGGVTAALGILTIAAGAAVISLTGIGALLIPLAPILIAIGAAVVIGIEIINEQNDAIKETIRLRSADAVAAKKAADIQVKESEAVLEAIESNIELVDGVIEQFFGDQIDDLREFNNKSIQEFDDFLSAFADSREAALKGIEAAISRADKTIASSTKRGKDALQKLADIDFDKSLEGLSETSRSTKLIERASKTAAKARQEFASSGQNEEKRRGALATRALAEEQVRDAKRAAAKSKGTSDDKKAADLERKFLQDIAKDEKKFTKESEQFKKDATAQIAEVTREFQIQSEALDELSVKIKKYFDLFDENKRLKTAEQQAEDFQKGADAVKEFNKVAGEDPSKGLAERAGVDISELQPLSIEATLGFKKNSAQSILNARNILESNVFQVGTEQRERREGQQLNLDTSNATQAVADLEVEISDKLGKLNKETIITPEMDFSKIRAGLASGVIGSLLTNSISGARATFETEIRAAANIADDASADQILASEGRLAALKTKLASAFEAEEVTPVEEAALQGKLADATSVLESSKNLIEARAVAAKAAEASAGTNLEAAKQPALDLAQSTANAADKAKILNAETAPLAGSMQAAVGPSGQVATNLERQAKASNEIKPAAAAGGAFFGKAIHRQTGGFTRGQDRILTSTAPGEVVINANAARGIRSELQAVNAQQSPQFRETGGAVTNIGDVNVNINTQDAGDIDGRNIGRDLKREFRTRGSSI